MLKRLRALMSSNTDDDHEQSRAEIAERVRLVQKAADEAMKLTERQVDVVKDTRQKSTRCLQDILRDSMQAMKKVRYSSIKTKVHAEGAGDAKNKLRVQRDEEAQRAERAELEAEWKEAQAERARLLKEQETLVEIFKSLPSS